MNVREVLSLPPPPPPPPTNGQTRPKVALFPFSGFRYMIQADLTKRLTQLAVQKNRKGDLTMSLSLKTKGNIVLVGH